MVILSFGLQGIALAGVDDGNGHEWRQLKETTGLTWNQIASVCPRDGETPCSGTVGGKVLTGWVWATDEQVIEFMGRYAPDLLTADPPQVSGPQYFVQALGFLNVMGATVSFFSNYSTSEWTGGWTSSLDGTGVPIGGGAGYSHPIFNGSFGVSPGGDPDVADPNRGVWMWRQAGLDYSAPEIAPTVTGTKGMNDWYVSDVSIMWDVADAESPIDSTVGCGPTSVTSDTPGATFRCEARSFGGASESSVTVKRDVTAPLVTCGTPAPVFPIGQLGAAVSATVADATSGAATPSVKGFANTTRAGSFSAAITGQDKAGNRSTTNCPYQVVIPPCRGFAPTIVGTTGNDVITGTASRDVILALAGADKIDGKLGNDVICGGDGPDIIYGGSGKDDVDGGASDDEIFGSAGDDYLNGGLNYDSLRGDAGKDTCTSGERRMSSCEVVLK
jgi:hypothetical protein